MASTQKAEDIMGFLRHYLTLKNLQTDLSMSTCVIYYNPVEQTGN